MQQVGDTTVDREAKMRWKKEKVDIMNHLDPSIISWNNEQVELLKKITKLNLDDWII